MNFELPLLRVDKKEYLEDLRRGKLYLRNNLYYQRLEADNEVRSDPNDGSLPTEGIVESPSIDGKTLRNMRITQGNAYIKCFYHYKQEDVVKINERYYRLTIPEEAKQSLMSFGSDHVMVISSPIIFTSRIEEAALKAGDTSHCENVEYFDEKGIRNKTIEFINGLNNGVMTSNPIFCKDIKYKDQQEFRVCVRHLRNDLLSTKISYGIEYYDITQEYIDTPYTINIESIEDISCIIDLKDLIEGSLVIDVVEKRYMLEKVVTE